MWAALLTCSTGQVVPQALVYEGAAEIAKVITGQVVGTHMTVTQRLLWCNITVLLGLHPTARTRHGAPSSKPDTSLRWC